MDPPTGQEKKDAAEKAAARRGRTAAASRPGVQSVRNADQAARSLDQRIAEKQRGASAAGKNTNAKTPPPSQLGQLEQDLAAKQRGGGAAAASTPGAVASSNNAAAAAAKSPPPSQLGQLEQDLAAKQRGARPAGAAVSTPGAVASTSSGTTQLEQDLAAKQRGRRPAAAPATTPGVQQASTKSGAAPAPLGQLEQDLAAKQRGRRPVAAAAAPGAQAFTTSNKKDGTAPAQLGQLEQDLAAKQRGRVVAPASTPGAQSSTTSGAPPAQLGRLEQDLAAKQRGRPAAAPAAVPGVVSSAGGGGGRAELNSLEDDVAAKQRARSGAAIGAQPAADALDRKVAAKIRGSSQANEQLNNLEAAVQAKMGVADSAQQQPPPPEPARAELRSLDERIASKNAAAGAPTPRSLQAAEESVMEKKGALNPTSMASEETVMGSSKDAAAGQLTAASSKDGDSGAGTGLETTGLQSNAQHPDVEYGVYGGEDEQGLAVAFAVEEEDEDMYIPSAVEYDPDAKPPMIKNRRFRLYACLAIAVAIIGVVGAAVGIVLSDDGGPPAVPYRETLGIRENVERLVGSDVLEDTFGPYRKALAWITHEDELQVTPENPTFMQRYLMAYFYFATSAHGAWLGGCSPYNPEVDDDPEDCIWERVGAIEPERQFSEIPWKRWLSGISECGWAGVYCDENGQMRTMELVGVGATGKFPDGVTKFPFLQSLTLNYNELEGTLPGSIGEMKHLVNFEAQGNLLTGSIPSSFYKSRSLQRINLSINQLSGPLGPEIGQLKDLKGLFLQRNILSGTIPDEIGDLRSSTFIRIGRNNINGTIPTTIGQLKNTYDFWFNRNDLVGSIPTELGGMESLEDLRLQTNTLTGKIPEGLWKLPLLYGVNLHENELTGTLSKEIGKSSKLFTFRVHDNKLTGTLPTEFGNLPEIDSIYISGNAITGTVAQVVCDRRGAFDLEEIQADCLAPSGGAAEIECSCCTSCCDVNGENCLEI